MSSANCLIEVPAVKGLEDNAVTVGRHVVFKCRMNAEAVPDLQSYYLKKPLPVPNSIRVFSVQQMDSDSFEVNLTFYQAGEYLPNQVILTDGVNELNMIGDSVKVASVIEASADGKSPEAYKSILPIGMGMPVLYWVLAAFVLISAVYLIWAYVTRINYYRQLKEGLKNYSSPLTPEDQFYKAMRMAEKKEFPLDEVERAFRVYVLRQYSLPMFELTDKRILRYFKHNFPRYKKVRQELQKILQEFETYRGLAQTDLNSDLNSKNIFIKKLYKFIQLAKEGVL
ncbi:hypothetical protein [Pseudobdellovibrio exovorus]|uniref:Uncharacterized protein n=1 Tax=Pseudobdellovibrio exovorus JSS TaxID=1184267 RepID=M4VAQ7_9BACT|nr:hypothetical protein [Pseudobdellovibrio exovorus]AGH95101.1 hypothetical protein A11Q_885 [Pseudobdellovibrio exovorus JSS]